MPPSSLLELHARALASGIYAQRIGLRLVSAADGRAEVDLPYRDTNTNRGGNLHGGAIASLMLAAGELAAASSEREPVECEGRTLNLAVSYLSAAREDDLRACATVERRGRDIVHVRLVVTTNRGASVAAGFTTYGIEAGRGLANETAVAVSKSRPAGPRPSRIPQPRSAYNRGAGIEIVDVAPGWATARMPLAPNAAMTGVVDPGAMTGLADTCAAMSALSGLAHDRPIKLATISMAVSFAVPAEGAVGASSRLAGVSGSARANQVEVWSPDDGRLAAVALISYRAVPEDDLGR